MAANNSLGALLLLLLLYYLGKLLGDKKEGGSLPATSQPPPPAQPSPSPALDRKDQIDLSTVRVADGGPDIRDWPIPSDGGMTVSVDGTFVHMIQGLTMRWPIKRYVGIETVGNPWVIAKRKGEWYMASWEWVGRGTIRKLKSAVSALPPYPHIGGGTFAGWAPKPGEKIFICMASLSRGNARSTPEGKNERSPFIEVILP